MQWGWPMPRACAVEGCEREHYARGRCGRHYDRERRGSTRHYRVDDPPMCKVEGCARDARARGYCPKHHSCWCRHGDPLAPSHRAPDYSGEELRRLHAHLDGIPAGRWAGPGEVEYLALVLGRAKAGLACKLSRMRQARREAARRDGTA